MTKPPNLSPEKAIEIGENCSCLAARKATRAVTQLYDKHLSKVGLRITQFTLLNAIRALDEIPIHMLATELVMDRTTLTRNLKPLVKAGWVDSTPSAKDARVRNLSLTTQGQHRLSQALPHWEIAQAEFIRKVGEPAWGRLSTDLMRVDRTLSPGQRPSDKPVGKR